MPKPTEFATVRVRTRDKNAIRAIGTERDKPTLSDAIDCILAGWEMLSEQQRDEAFGIEPPPPEMVELASGQKSSGWLAKM